MDFWGITSIDHTIHNCCAIKQNSNIRSFNRVCNVGSVLSSDVININSFFGEMPYAWVVDDADRQTIEMLEQQGLHYKTSCSAMMLDLIDIQPCTKATIQEIMTESELLSWIAVVAESFHYSVEEFSKATHALKKRAGDAVKFYLGRWDEKAVAASMVIQHAEIISIHKVGTLPAYRGKGIGSGMMQKILYDAQEQGYKKAILLAAQSSKSLYEKMGFCEFAVYKIYGN